MKSKTIKFKSLVAPGLIIIALLALTVIVVELASRAPNAPNITPAVAQIPTAFPREIKDAAGETLVIKSDPIRIVSQTLGTDEILLSICSTERIVALSSLAEDPNYSNVVAEAKQIPDRVTEGAEQILQLQPDLIFVASYSRAETVQLLKASNAPVFRFANFDSIEDVTANIKIVGAATGCDTAAEKLVAQMNEKLWQISARIPNNQNPPRVMSFGREGFTAGGKTLFDGIVRAAGAVNVSAENGLEGFPKISGEKVIEWQPDYIITGANTDDIDNKKRQLLADPIIAATKAGKRGRVIVIDNRYFLTVSHHVVRAIEILSNEFQRDFYEQPD